MIPQMYTFRELTDMLLIYTKVNKNGLTTAREYRGKYPDRRVPNHRTVEALERCVWETGTLKP